MVILESRNLTKVYTHKGVNTTALNEFSFTVNEGEFVGIMGPSGSGKTTLLNILGTLDQPTSGVLCLNGKDVSNLDKEARAQFRRDNLGFIFQDFNLLDSLTLKENIILPLVLAGESVELIESRLMNVTPILDIDNLIDKYPYQVSGGQQQRAAAARAIIVNPTLLMADEPTGNLDSKSARELMNYLKKLNTEYKSTIIMVTHDPATASYCNRVIFIKDGQYFNEISKNKGDEYFYDCILHMLKRMEVEGA